MACTIIGTTIKMPKITRSIPSTKNTVLKFDILSVNNIYNFKKFN